MRGRHSVRKKHTGKSKKALAAAGALAFYCIDGKSMLS